MKKRKIAVGAALVLSLAGVLLAGGSEADAKKKAKPKQNYTVKGTTLTVTGTLKRSASIKNAKKMKKIVVKKGIKSLPVEPFQSCKKVKKLEVPGNLVFTYKDAEYGKHNWSFPVVVDSVKFTSALGDRDRIEYYETKSFQVSKSDAKFSSQNGNVYNKKGDTLVGVPSQATSLQVADGCKTVDFSAFSYLLKKSQVGEDWSDADEGACKKLAKISFPASVTKFVCNRKYGYYFKPFGEKAEFSIANTQLDTQSIELFFEVIQYDSDRLLQMFPQTVEIKNDFVILNKNYALVYTGCEEEVVVPEGIETMSSSVFSYDIDRYRLIQKVILPTSFKGKLEDFWTYRKDDMYIYNREEEITVTSAKKERYYSYCRHEAGKEIPMKMDADGLLVVRDNNYPMAFYDADKKPISITPFRDKCTIIKEVKKGDIVYAKVPEKAENSKEIIYGQITMPYILSYNDSAFEGKFNEKWFKGTGSEQYLNFSLKTKTDVWITTTGAENTKTVTVQIQKKQGETWKNMTEKFSQDKQGTWKRSFIADKGEYRIALNAGKDVYYLVETNTSQTYSKKLPTKKSAAGVLKKDKNYEDGFTWTDGKTAWYKMSFKSKEKRYLFFTGNRLTPVKVKVTLYQKGKKKAVKKKTVNFASVKNNGVQWTVKKGTYYIKVERTDTKQTCSYDLVTRGLQ